MNSPDRAALCPRVDEHPHHPSSDLYQDNCRWCGAAVWRSTSSSVETKVLPAICRPCAAPVLEQREDELGLVHRDPHDEPGDS